MREALHALRDWLPEGRPVALATVVRTWGSAPRQPGSKMAVHPDGRMAGSVSGGCVEAAVVEEAAQVLASGAPRLLQFDVQDETAWGVGLTCGGRLEVFLEPVAPQHPVFQTLLEAVGRDQPAARAVIVQGPPDRLGQSAVLAPGGETLGDLDPQLMRQLAPQLQSSLGSGQAGAWAGPEQIELFLDPLLPAATLAIVGAVHIAMALTRLAKVLGYRVVVIDPRRRFTTPDRFPEADALLTAWPEEGLRQAGLTASTAVAVLSHDPKLDDPAIIAALRSPAGYVGVLGSRRTQALRRKRLQQTGLTDEQLARLHAPIGLDLGGGAPEEIALSILAEIVAHRVGQAGVEVWPMETRTATSDPGSAAAG